MARKQFKKFLSQLDHVSALVEASKGTNLIVVCFKSRRRLVSQGMSVEIVKKN